MKRLAIIYPEDPSTDFLSSIVDSLNKIVNLQIILLRTYPSQESYADTVKQVMLLDSQIPIIFLGHGHSRCLYGGTCPYYERQSLFNVSNGITVFKDRKVIFLACNSADYIEAMAQHIKIGLGFGHILSDWDEVKAIREVDAGIYQDLTKQSIFYFRQSLNTIFINSFTELYLMDYTLSQFYSRLKLRINKKIIEVLKSSESDKLELGQLFYTLKDDIKYFENSNNTFFSDSKIIN